MNASTRLRDLAIRHGVYLERYTKAQAKELRQILTQAANEIEAKIRATGGQFTKDRLEALLRDTRSILTEATSQQIQPKLFSAVDDLAVYELEQGQADLRRAIPAQIELTSPDPGQVLSAVRFNPTAGGALLGDLFKKWEQSTADDFVTQIRLGVVQGETVQQLTRRIRGEVIARASRNRPGVYEGGVLQTTTRGAETLVRTAVAHVNAQSRDELYKANEDLIKSYQYVATLDAATCLVCGPIDGKEYPDLESAPVVPQHFNCRCVVLPVLKSFRELGIDLDEIAPGTRASMDGQVPEKTTYADWLKSRPESEQRDILGPGRYALFSNGLPLSDMRSDAGKVVNLDALRQLDEA